MTDAGMNDGGVNAGGQPGQGQGSGPAGASEYGQGGQAGDQSAYNGYGPYANDPNQYNQQYGNPNMNQQSAQPGSNEWWQMNPFKLAEEWLPNQAKKTIRIIYGVVGVVAVLLGLALLIWPGKTLVVFAVALGIYFLISGAIRIIGAIVENGLPGGWRVLDILVGILLAVGGVVMLKNTVLSTAMLTILVTLAVGIGWMMEGIMALVETWRLPSSGWAIFYGVISIIAGIVVLFSPFASMLWLIIFAGCAMLVMGVVAIVRAFRFGRH